jgi:hypothetical protein
MKNAILGYSSYEYFYVRDNSLAMAWKASVSTRESTSPLCKLSHRVQLVIIFTDGTLLVFQEQKDLSIVSYKPY